MTEADLGAAEVDTTDAGAADVAGAAVPAGEDRTPPAEPWVPIDARFAGLVERWRGRVVGNRGRVVEAAISVVTVVAGTALILATLHPSRLWSTTTPTGGDMGAHVWGPRYLMDHLLPHFRLTGWTPDWYDGFPAYQFYMVVPSLLIVALTVGLPGPWWVVAPLVLLALGAAIAGCYASPTWYPRRRIVIPVAVVLAVLAIPVPYERSFKLITALGLLGLPAACWAFGKLADLPFPMPPMLTVGGLIFVYNREPLYNGTGNIIGGNFQSTMAGEFAFSISLTFAILYLGVAARGLRTGRHRALAAGLFAMAGLCHLIPAFFVLACTLALVLVHPDRARLRWLATMVPVAGLLTAFWVLPFLWRRHYVNDMGWEVLPELNANTSDAAKKLAGDQQSVVYYLFPPGLRWLMYASGLGVVVSVIRRYAAGIVLGLAWSAAMLAFWLIPQYRLWNARLLPFLYLSVSLLAAIALGELIRLAGAAASGRADRPLRAIVLPATVLSLLGGFLYVALPLTVVNGVTIGPIALDRFVYLLVALGVGLGLYLWLGARADRAPSGGGSDGLPGAAGAGAFVVLLALGTLAAPLSGALGSRQVGPYSPIKIHRSATEVIRDDGSKETATRSSLWMFSTNANNPVAGWADWNYKGLELKTASPAGCDAPGSTTACTTGGWKEYRALVDTMAKLGKDPDHGCGRSLWEYSKDRLDGYGTPMALMLLPYWTDGCIGSQEGLYFESSTTVPYHFLMQVELSEHGSGAQRALDYPSFDVAAGVRHLQLLGVKYYLATTTAAVAQADTNPDLTAVATSGPWHIYEVADAPVVQALEYQPVVATGIDESQAGWLPNAAAWFLKGDLEVPMAIDGPSEWKRVAVDPVPEDDRLIVRWVRGQLGLGGTIDQTPKLPEQALPSVKVTNTEMGRDTISFDVSRTGVPVLVKASYFPNWEVDGAKGPYRVTPNLMVVIPTSDHVTLHYARTPIDLLAILLTILGLAGLVWLVREDPIEVAPIGPGRVARWLDELVTIAPRPTAPPMGEGGATVDYDPDDGTWRQRVFDPADGSWKQAVYDPADGSWRPQAGPTGEAPIAEVAMPPAEVGLDASRADAPGLDAPFDWTVEPPGDDLEPT